MKYGSKDIGQKSKAGEQSLNKDTVESCINTLESTIEGMDNSIREKHILLQQLYRLKTQKLLEDHKREIELQRQANRRTLLGS